MVVEENLRIVAEPAAAPEFGDVEDVVDARGVVAAKLRRHVAPRVFLDVFSVFLAKPAHADDIAIVDGRKFRPAEAGNVDILARCAADRQHLVHREVRMFASVSLLARQPFELHRGAQLIVLEQRGDAVMTTRVHRENELGH